MDESVQDPAFTPEVTADNPTPDESAPVEQGQGAEQADFAERFDPSSLDETLAEQYRLMRGDYSTKTMSLADERKAFESERDQHQQATQLMEALQQDPEGTLQQLQELLLEEAAQDDEYDYSDDEGDNPVVSELQQRLDRLEAEKHSERQQQADVHWLAQDVEQINKIRGESDPLTEEELNVLGQFAQRDQQGNLRLIDAYKTLDQWFGMRQQKYIAGKRPPAPPGTGSAGSEKFDITNKEQRIQRMQALLDGGGQ